MNVSAIGNQTSASAAAFVNYGDPDVLSESKPRGSEPPSPADIKKAASQFEAIILRQLLKPSIEPIMSGGMGGSGGSGGGGGMYGFMLTDVLADNLSKGGGLGLARMLEKQLSPRVPGADITSEAALKPSILSSKIK